jgi:hypothetical protein
MTAARGVDVNWPVPFAERIGEHCGDGTFWRRGQELRDALVRDPSDLSLR